jgi:hypothetical protein
LHHGSLESLRNKFVSGIVRIERWANAHSCDGQSVFIPLYLTPPASGEREFER